MPRVCVSLTPKNTAELKRQLEQAGKKTDLVEVRLDFMKDPGKALPLIKKSRLEVIATLRPKWECGRFGGSEEKRAALLEKAAEAAEFIDVELRAGKKIRERIIRAARKNGARVIVSWHDFKGTPSRGEIEKVIDAEEKAGADVCKVVATARKFPDNNTMLEVLRAKKAGTRLLAFCMGETGIASRILSPLFGAEFTYASLEYGKAAAPGQVSIDDVREIYEVISRSKLPRSTAA